MMVIGLDCATEDAKIGVALGDYRDGHVSVSRVELCSREKSASSVAAGWLAGATDALLAIDAPLGWPAALATALTGHKAGDALEASPDSMFRRDTDPYV